MTDRQRYTVNILQEYYMIGEEMPTVRELARRLGVSVATAHRRLESLEKLGLVQLPGTNRKRIELTEEGKK